MMLEILVDNRLGPDSYPYDVIRVRHLTADRYFNIDRRLLGYVEKRRTDYHP